MAEKLNFGNEKREFKIGASFTQPKSTGFHTIRYDFKPASVDVSKSATVDVAANNQVTITVPHLDGAGTSHTVFKGSQKPYQKECILIIDPKTGEITLERLSRNIQVKKTRAESIKPPVLETKKEAPVKLPKKSTKDVKQKPKTKAQKRAVKPDARTEDIRIEESIQPEPVRVPEPLKEQIKPVTPIQMAGDLAGDLSASSSSSSSSDSDLSDSEPDDQVSNQFNDMKVTESKHELQSKSALSELSESKDVLTEDLCLSESDSD